MNTTIKERIREANRIEDSNAIRDIADALRLGRLKLNGTPVIFNYADTRNFFMRCDPTIDAGRFEELMQLADYA